MQGMEETNIQPLLGKIPWRRQWQPTLVFCLRNPVDWGAWRATVHGVTKWRQQQREAIWAERRVSQEGALWREGTRGLLPQSQSWGCHAGSYSPSSHSGGGQGQRTLRSPLGGTAASNRSPAGLGLNKEACGELQLILGEQAQGRREGCSSGGETSAIVNFNLNNKGRIA